MTTKRWLALCASLLLAGAIGGRCWQGRMADRAYTALLARYTAHLRTDSLAVRVDSARTDTIKVVTTRIVHDSAAAVDVGKLADSVAGVLRAQLADSSQRVFAAFERAVATRDSLRLAQISGLDSVIAIQQRQIVDTRARLVELDALLSQSMGQLRSALARADRRWHLAACGGLGASTPLAGGSVVLGPQVGLCVAYVLF